MQERKILGLGIVASFCLFLLAVPPTFAIHYNVSIDVSSLLGSGLELEIDLYDNSGTIGDSWALIDNVMLGAVVEDFEFGDIGGFDDSLNPASVDAVLGSLYGGGNYVMRIDEDPTFNPTITWRDFAGSSAAILGFSFQFFGDAGGQDELVFSILDPVSLDPLLPGLTPGFGDVLAVQSDGMDHIGAVTVAVIPEPVTMFGICMGIAGMAGYIHRRRNV